MNIIKEKIKTKENNAINIIAVSKTFQIHHIKPVIDHGHIHFGENKVQKQLKSGQTLKKNLRI